MAIVVVLVPKTVIITTFGVFFTVVAVGVGDAATEGGGSSGDRGLGYCWASGS